jgi:hypothetical protein
VQALDLIDALDVNRPSRRAVQPLGRLVHIWSVAGESGCQAP